MNRNIKYPNGMFCSECGKWLLLPHNQEDARPFGLCEGYHAPKPGDV